MVEPSSTVYKGFRVHETPPPTHGVAALAALNILECLHSAPPVSSNDRDLGGAGTDSGCEGLLQCRGSAEQAHLGIESMRVGFSDALQHVSDPDMVCTVYCTLHCALCAVLYCA